MHNSHFPKHPVNHALMEMPMPVQAGAYSVDECDGINVQGTFIHLGCTRDVELQALPIDRMASPRFGMPLQRCATSAHKSSS